jgi:hypothetical protein
MLSIGQRAYSRRIHTVIEFGEWSYIGITKNAFHVIGKETESSVSDDFKVSLLAADPL